MVGSSGQRTGASPLLGTKLYVPKRRATLVPRPRLVQRLAQGAEHALTLISAPAVSLGLWMTIKGFSPSAPILAAPSAESGSPDGPATTIPPQAAVATKPGAA